MLLRLAYIAVVDIVFLWQTALVEEMSAIEKNDIRFDRICVSKKEIMR